jgi:hypothetical protein
MATIGLAALLIRLIECDDDAVVVLCLCDSLFARRTDRKVLTASNADARQSQDDATIVLCDLRC